MTDDFPKTAEEAARYIKAAPDRAERQRRKGEVFHLLYGGPARPLTIVDVELDEADMAEIRQDHLALSQPLTATGRRAPGPEMQRLPTVKGLRPASSAPVPLVGLDLSGLEGRVIAHLEAMGGPLTPDTPKDGEDSAD